MKTIQCVQKSVEWWTVRRGVPTASEFDSILTPKTMKPSTAQETYIYRLIAERFAPVWPKPDTFVNKAMQYGIETEDNARAWYGFDAGCDVQQVGFCLSDCGRYGASPDGLIDPSGCLELKCPDLSTHAKYLLEGVLPSEYRCQVHGELIVTGREWCDFVSYSEGLPVFRIRVEPDGFTETLRDEVEKFCDKYQAALKRIEHIRNHQ